MKKVVVITGASSGIGLELAKLIQKKGYALILSGRSDKGLEIFKNDPSIDLVPGDLTHESTIWKITEICETKYKKVDILINNAGISNIQPFETVTQEQIEDIISTNLLSHMKLTHLLYPLMKKQQFGHIVFVNSSAGIDAKLHHTLYCASKFGLAGFAKSLRLEAKKFNIRVTSVHPGGVKTNLYHSLPHPPDITNFMDPKKIAEMIVFLTETEGISPDEIIINRI